MISARKTKHLDVKNMFTYSHANTPLGQSERAYYLSYFINVNAKGYGARSGSFRFCSIKRDPVPLTFRKCSIPWKQVCVIKGYVLKNEKC